LGLPQYKVCLLAQRNARGRAREGGSNRRSTEESTGRRTVSRSKWAASLTYAGKRHHLGSFKDEEEAARAYDGAARAHHGEKAQLNFPAEGESGHRKSSKYRGVNWKKSNSKWVAVIRNDGKQHHLGCFDDEEEAARAYDRAARTHHGEKAQLNFPAKQLKEGA
jgi:hypothetical protein